MSKLSHHPIDVMAKINHYLIDTFFDFLSGAFVPVLWVYICIMSMMWSGYLKNDGIFIISMLFLSGMGFFSFLWFELAEFLLRKNLSKCFYVVMYIIFACSLTYSRYHTDREQFCKYFRRSIFNLLPYSYPDSRQCRF